MITEKTTNRELYSNYTNIIGRSVQLTGWIRNIRTQKNLIFADFSDGSYFRNVQLVAESGITPGFDDIARSNNGAAVIVSGTVERSVSEKQPFEIRITSWQQEGRCPPEYPLQPKRHSPEFLRSIGHLRPRTNLFSAVFRVRSEAAFAIHRFFNERGFVYVHTPIITGSDCEGAGEMFRVTTLDPVTPPMTDDGSPDYSRDFFGKQTSLTVSGQLNAESFAQAFGKVYTFGPTFRAENSNTTRHAAEFWMIEPEIAFADLNDDMALAEDMLKSVISYVIEKCPEELQFFNSFVDKGLIDRLNNVISNSFGILTYTEAIEKLKDSGVGFSYPVEWGSDLQTEHERYITEKLFGKPVFITDYPKEIKAFYMKLNPDGRTVAAMDCLVPGVGEIIGGSQREDNADRLVNRMIESGLDPEDYSWYLDLRKYGSTRHAGFGLGFERLIMYLTGVSNIRDVIPFPRTTGSADF